jgi:hypothetical protein
LLKRRRKLGAVSIGHNQLPKLIFGVKFADGLEVTAKPDRRQPTTTAA